MTNVLEPTTRMKEDRVYLLHIRDAIARIESYTGGDKSGFLQDTMIQDAVIRSTTAPADGR